MIPFGGRRARPLRRHPVYNERRSLRNPKNAANARKNLQNPAAAKKYWSAGVLARPGAAAVSAATQSELKCGRDARGPRAAETAALQLTPFVTSGRHAGAWSS